MTFFYQTQSWSSQPQVTQETVNLWKHVADKKNWRIVQLPNGFYQTEHKDINCKCDPQTDTCCEKWIDVTRRELRRRSPS
jgi:hypothetical protein